jgi:hypothetical protein
MPLGLRNMKHPTDLNTCRTRVPHAVHVLTLADLEELQGNRPLGSSSVVEEFLEAVNIYQTSLNILLFTFNEL